jgi:predicted transcriptional regulator of viral defense system
MKKSAPQDRLFEIAVGQGGYFTARQAVLAGFSGKNHAYHVKAGHWAREWRGLYRLVRYPIPDDAQYALWGVWSCNRKGEQQGVYSHETALSLCDLSDLQPEKLHMTVPRGYRRHGPMPRVLVLHHAGLKPAECEERPGYRVTRPFRTIADLVRARTVSPEFTKQAVQQALERGQLSRTQYRTLKEMPRIGRRLREIMGDDKQ